MTAPRLAALLALLALLALPALAGCGGAGPREASLHPLAGTVALTEVTSDGERIAIAPGGISEVDINSRIEIHVERTRVEQVFEGQGRADPADAARIRSQLGELSRLTQMQKAAMERLAALSARWVQEGRPAVPSQALRDANAKRELQQLKLNEAIASYATAAGQPKARYFEGRGGPLAVWTALDEERGRVLAEAAQLAGRAAALRWRMQAVFARGKPIHLDNYDTYPDGPFGIVDKLVPQTTARELAAGLAEAKQLAKDLQDLSGAKDALVKAALGQLADLVGSLKEALRDDLDAIAALAREVPDGALKLKEVKAVKAELGLLADAIADLRAPCTAVLDAISAGSPGSLQLGRVGPCLRAVLRAGPGVLDRARAAGAAVRTLLDLVEKQPARLGALLAPLRALAPRLETVKLVETWAVKVSGGWGQTRSLLELQAEAIEVPVWSADQQTDQLVGELTDTVIDLRRTDRKEGDLLHFRPSIVKADGTAVLLGPTADFRVARMGTYIDVSAGVSFVDKRDDAWGPFTAAPGITAAVHHRWRPGGAFTRTLNALRPGVGVHFLYPDLGRRQVDAAGNESGEDPAFELGVGGSVLLFGDLLQVGIGYDLQVSTGYWYVGFGLDTLARLGVRFSPGS